MQPQKLIPRPVFALAISTSSSSSISSSSTAQSGAVSQSSALRRFRAHAPSSSGKALHPRPHSAHPTTAGQHADVGLVGTESEGVREMLPARGVRCCLRQPAAHPPTLEQESFAQSSSINASMPRKDPPMACALLGPGAVAGAPGGGVDRDGCRAARAARRRRASQQRHAPCRPKACGATARAAVALFPAGSFRKFYEVSGNFMRCTEI